MSARNVAVEESKPSLFSLIYTQMHAPVHCSLWELLEARGFERLTVWHYTEYTTEAPRHRHRTKTCRTSTLVYYLQNAKTLHGMNIIYLIQSKFTMRNFHITDNIIIDYCYNILCIKTTVTIPPSLSGILTSRQYKFNR